MPIFKGDFKFILRPYLVCMLVVLTTYLLRSFYKRIGYQLIGKEPLSHIPSRSTSTQPSGFFSRIWSRLRRTEEIDPALATQESPPSPTGRKRMRHRKTARTVKPKKVIPETEASVETTPRTKQPYELFLVVDFEGTCEQDSGFDYPNEIIEFPVSLLEWTDRTEETTATTLKVVDEFRTFVKPTWRPILSKFCTQLTGITQDQVDSAPHFAEALDKLEEFLVKHGLVESNTRKRLKRFCWCSDGPWDIRDIFVKQCFISQLQMPEWIRGDVLDVRSAVQQWKRSQNTPSTKHTFNVRPSLNISAQLNALSLPAFEGRQHSGIDDTRNIARIVAELARRGVCLLPNTAIYPGRRWRWMGKHGQVLEGGLL